MLTLIPTQSQLCPHLIYLGQNIYNDVLEFPFGNGCSQKQLVLLITGNTEKESMTTGSENEPSPACWAMTSVSGEGIT